MIQISGTGLVSRIAATGVHTMQASAATTAIRSTPNGAVTLRAIRPFLRHWQRLPTKPICSFFLTSPTGSDCLEGANQPSAAEWQSCGKKRDSVCQIEIDAIPTVGDPCGEH